MPLVYYDIVRGRSRDQIRALLDSTQAAIVEAFETPERDLVVSAKSGQFLGRRVSTRRQA
jgi:hypothetical protein